MSRHCASGQTASLLVVLISVFSAPAAGQDSNAELKNTEPNAPKIATASDEGKLSLQGYQIPDGVTGKLFAAEPMFANPVAFYVDDRGRVLVCETFRQESGVVDNRSYGKPWVDADLAAMTVEDRRQYHLEQLTAEEAHKFVEEDDQIRILIDTNNDGVADKESVFADHFNDLVDGTGAGVLEYRGNIYYTCIPSVYLMRDEDNDLKADGKTVLHTGYGVRVAFRGHDLHGLCIGPDGRLYFSIGDRGANIEVEGKKLVNAESGSVFRCELDGADLEIFATGLRNPQELAFDEFGNLFTGDNNSDSGDQARWVYVVEGGDTGWRMAYQYLSDRGPFNREKIWHPKHDGQPYYIIPPIANISDGPSGLEYYPGTGFGSLFQGQFLLADFRGTPSRSGIRSIRNEPDGAFFKIAEDGQPFWKVLATDLQFGPDGGLYVSDWVDGWNGEGKGRLYRFTYADRKEELVKEVQDFLASDIAEIESQELAAKLSHVDRRLRHKSQLELAQRGDQDLLIAAAKSGKTIYERLHGVWGLDHLARRDPKTLQVATEIWIELSADKEAEIRANAIRLIGEHERQAGIDEVVAALKDAAPRVRHFALLSTAKLAVSSALDAVLAEIADNAGSDPVLRHAGVMALQGIADAKVLASLKDHSDIHVRLSAVVALRRLQDVAVAAFLADQDELVVAEAARAIHDAPIDAAMSNLAELIQGSFDSPSIVRRVLDANYRVGKAEALAAFVTEGENSEEMRIEAIKMLGAWAQPDGRDRVTGMWRPIKERPDASAKAAVASLVENFTAPEVNIRLALGKVASSYGMASSKSLLRAVITNTSMDIADRAAALQAMSQIKVTPDDLDLGLKSDEPELRAAALTLLRKALPKQAKEMLGQAALSGSIPEQQIAIRELGEMKNVEDVVLPFMQAWAAGGLPKEVHLEALETAEKQSAESLKKLLAEVNNTREPDSPLAQYRETLFGGDADRGEKIFRENVSLSCVRCHKVSGSGGEVGPDLTKIAVEKSREYLLEAIVDPNKVIAKGFESAVLLDYDDLVHSGVVREEDDDSITLIDAEGKITKYLKDDIAARNPGKSGMPADLITKMTKRELRDLVEYLAALDGTRKAGPATPEGH